MKPAALFAVIAATILSGCHAPDPPRATFVLGRESPAQPAEVSQLGQAVIEVTLTQLPDYLDTTDIVRRVADDRVASSDTGRWGERLSVGITDAVAASLAERLPAFAVTASPPASAPWRQVRITIDQFAVRPDGNCVLVAEWNTRIGRDGPVIAKQRIVLVAPVGGTDDAALVAAMSHEVETLADRIAAGLRVS